MEKSDTLLALAEQFKFWFPELEGQVAAVTEAEFTKETAPNLPFGMVALVNATVQSNENDATKTLVAETILFNILLPIERYKRQDGSESPFWAHYPYKQTLDLLIYNLNQWVSPEKSRVYMMQMEIDTTNFAAVISFRLRHTYKSCYQPEVDGCVPITLLDGKPLQIFGSSCPALEVCETTCCEEETDKCQKST